jgi:hypothetical protein
MFLVFLEGPQEDLLEHTVGFLEHTVEFLLDNIQGFVGHTMEILLDNTQGFVGHTQGFQGQPVLVRMEMILPYSICVRKSCFLRLFYASKKSTKRQKCF